MDDGDEDEEQYPDEEEWCDEQRSRVVAYLKTENVEHGRVGEWPAWHVAPYVSIWAIESLKRPEWIGWWAIAGDLPTDYISAAEVDSTQHPRKAMRVFAEHWLQVVEAWKQGREPEDLQIGKGSDRTELLPLLEERAGLLSEWSEDESMWKDDRPSEML